MYVARRFAFVDVSHSDSEIAQKAGSLMAGTLARSSPSPHCRWPGPTLQQGIERLFCPQPAATMDSHDPLPRSVWTAACRNRVALRGRLAADRERLACDGGAI